ncbi:MAG: hypothetical protein ACNS60_17395 [Candidatus Cyclobacteriaceae bacterium M2_1C_046]
MSAAKLKGNLLEFIVRRLLLRCGFRRVRPDGVMIFNNGGLTMINGKGAAHDADVLMSPPIQMPFSYPFRLNFECKAHKSKTSLTIVRNALGLRYDLNEFEIVTEDQIRERQNNMRGRHAIAERERYNYQVGVASIEDFTKTAFEFAANNKISLISLRWFLPGHICDLFHDITPDYLDRLNPFNPEIFNRILRENDIDAAIDHLPENDEVFRPVLNTVRELESRVIIGLTEAGDLLFLIGEQNIHEQFLNVGYVLNARYHFTTEREITEWTLAINDIQSELNFYLPERILNMWEDQNYELNAALDLKARVFKRIFIFITQGEIPFRIINLDGEWLERQRRG